ncbi:MAG: hypothetical protein HY716_16290 [Planctomycetes bacterium]|nr:hypothetical protein [Gammaproteobacteria bacterium]MBI4566245.1 hypothetical protein [Planctomycetota bacterium]
MNVETDVDMFLAGEADRLRVVAFAHRGLAGDMGRGGLESKVLHASAAELEAVARRLDAVRVRLCRTCKVLEVVEGRGSVGSRGQQLCQKCRMIEVKERVKAG